MKKVLNIWPQNKCCIDVLLFDENFHIHYIGKKEKCTNWNLSYLLVVQNFKILGQEVTEKKKAKIILTTLVLFTAIHLIVLSMYTKFEDSSTYRC